MERAVTHLSHLWQTKSQDGRGCEDREGERKDRRREGVGVGGGGVTVKAVKENITKDRTPPPKK